MLRLDIGSGGSPKDGFTGVDLFAEGEGIIKAPMNALPYGDESVDEIYSSHALEHIGKYEVVPTLAEWHRVLKWDAQLTLEVPDLTWVCKNWLQRQTNDWHLDAIFGDQSTPGQYHKTGFTRNILANYLEQAGFIGRTVTFWTVFSHEQDCILASIVK